ncbi:hypothetical protein V6N13_010093 [Hibiscus sabdariffa]
MLGNLLQLPSRISLLSLKLPRRQAAREMLINRIRWLVPTNQSVPATCNNAHILRDPLDSEVELLPTLHTKESRQDQASLVVNVVARFGAHAAAMLE